MLKTLCMQHGQLESFVPVVGQDQAIVSYVNQTDAVKAQKALNLCPLAGTLLLVDFILQAVQEVGDSTATSTSDGIIQESTWSVNDGGTDLMASADNQQGGMGSTQSYWNEVPVGTSLYQREWSLGDDATTEQWLDFDDQNNSFLPDGLLNDQ